MKRFSIHVLSIHLAYAYVVAGEKLGYRPELIDCKDGTWRVVVDGITREDSILMQWAVL